MLKHSVLRLLLFLAYASAGLCAEESTGDQTAGRPPIAGYIPLKWPCYFGAGLFGFTAIFHTLHFFRSGRPRYSIVLLIGMLAMTAGFILRLRYISDPYSVMSYAISSSVTILSPCLMIAHHYVMLAHLAVSLGDEVAARCLLVRRSRLVKIFLAADIVTFLIQAAAGGMAASAGNNPDMGKYSEWGMLGGLGLQVITFTWFSVILVHFGLAVRSHYPAVWHTHKESFTYNYNLWSVDPVEDWHQLFYVLIIGAVAILIRCIFRCCEYVGGHDSYLATHEGFFYALDALPLWLGMSLFALLWPTRVLSATALEHAYDDVELNKRMLHGGHPHQLPEELPYSRPS